MVQKFDVFENYQFSFTNTIYISTFIEVKLFILKIYKFKTVVVAPAIIKRYFQHETCTVEPV
jgi:hypothetical protein